MELNHTIVWATDEVAAAREVAGLLGLPDPVRWGPFEIIELANGVIHDNHPTTDPVPPQHNDYLFTDQEFQRVIGRLEERGQTYWADPGLDREGINTNDGGRGAYFRGPDDHLYEVITRPYGSG
jgi:hypothetical protein